MFKDYSEQNLKQEPATIGLVFSGLSAASSIMGAMGGSEKAPPPPKIEKPKIAPVTDDKTATRARQMEAQRKYASAGRAGTILSEGSGLG